MTICEKDLSISVCGIPACGSLDPPTDCRPAIEGYTDLLLSPACALDVGVGPAWDGVFRYGGNCFWDAFDFPPSPLTIKSGKVLTGAAVVENSPIANNWLLQILSTTSGGTPIVVWWGHSPIGTGGLGSRPTGLTFDAYFGPPPPFGLRCGFLPLQLKIVAHKL